VALTIAVSGQMRGGSPFAALDSTTEPRETGTRSPTMRAVLTAMPSGDERADPQAAQLITPERVREIPTV
jgi:hypothetical protein